MIDYIWTDVDNEHEYESIEEAIMTCCNLCGDRLEWDLSISYNSKHDIPVIKGESFSCGVKYRLYYDPDIPCYKIETYV